MSGRKQHANKALTAVTILLCLSCGTMFTRSAANSTSSGDVLPDMIVADNTDEKPQQVDAKITATETPAETEAPAEVTDTPVPEETAAHTEEPGAFEASPEASIGVWTPVGSSWYFMVDGAGYIGWLTDTDGSRYYFDSNAVMQTGWMDIEGKRYYLNADGVMQTGNVEIDGTVYAFDKNGVLTGEAKDVSQDTLLHYTASANAVQNAALAAAAVSGSNTASSAEKTDTAPADDSKNDTATEKTQAPADDKTVSKGQIALTFDDGPSDFTPRLLDCLEANNAHATFFMTGTQIEYIPDTLNRMEALGCELGNHSYDHADLSTLSQEEISSEFSRTDDLIQAQVGHAASLVRPPYGNISDAVGIAAARPLILWSVDTEDALDPANADASQIAELALAGARDGAIILMHDIFGTSVDAAEIVIPKLIEEGYDLVTISELADAKGVSMEAGASYGSFS